MQTMIDVWESEITAPSRELNARVELWRSSTPVIFLPEDYLVSIKIERTPEKGKFFGYTICQKATIEILDAAEAPFEFLKGDPLLVEIGTISDLASFPYFYIDEIKRDEVTKKITLVAYDIMNTASKILFKDIFIGYPDDYIGMVQQIADALKVASVWRNGTPPMVLYFEEDAPNFNGTETARQVLAAIAEATGTICFIDSRERICFKKLGGEPVWTIDKDNYFEFKLGKSATISQVVHTNELNDTTAATAAEADGYIYVMRNNPFIDLRHDRNTLINNIQEFVCDGTIYQEYELKWRGNPALDIGDVVAVTDKNDENINIIYFGETITYNGGMIVTSSWSLAEEENVEAPAPTISEAISQTSARVDKVNNEISLVAGRVEENASNIGNLVLTTEDITASVQQVEAVIDEGLTSLNDEITTLSKKVELGITAEDVEIAISSELANGVDKVTTSTGYTFNQDGLTVSKSTSDITTTITEDGMTVARGGETVLTANNEGVIAEDLHATTYLIIGNYSRFEDYEGRTGCFWIG